MEESIQIVIDLAEFVIFTGAISQVLYPDEYQYYIVRGAVFAVGELINTLILDKKKIFIRLFPKESDNKLLQRYIFALLFQTFVTAFIADKNTIILKDAISVTAVYLTDLIVKKIRGD